MKFDYPAELPICAAHDEIIEAIKSSQVVIVSGQTGSGKTTQIPKMVLELGRGGRGKQIVHTQPRRLAARTVAERIANEMEVKLGDLPTKVHLKQSFELLLTVFYLRKFSEILFLLNTTRLLLTKLTNAVLTLTFC